MMRLSCLLIFCCSLLLFSCGEEESPQPPKPPELSAADVVRNLKRDAADRAMALQKKDYEGLVRYTPEKIIRNVGGPAAMQASIEKAMTNMEGKNTRILETSVGKPGPVKKDGDRLLALVPEERVLKVTGGRTYGERKLLGISENGGRNWVFIDEVKLRDERYMNKNFPELAGKMELPPQGATRFEKDMEGVSDELTAEEMTENLKRDATACAAALAKGDYEGMTRYVPKKMVAMVGGTKGYRKMLEMGMEKMGAAVIAATVGEPGTVIKDGDRLLCLVPLSIKAKTPVGRITGTGWQLGISENGGRDWVFVDTAKMKEARFAKIFPELVGKIEVPETEVPQLETD